MKSCFSKLEIGESKTFCIGKKETYFVKVYSDTERKYTEDDIVKLLDYIVSVEEPFSNR